MLGHEAMRKMAVSNVLVSGMKGLGVEIGKFCCTIDTNWYLRAFNKIYSRRPCWKSLVSFCRWHTCNTYTLSLQRIDVGMLFVKRFFTDKEVEMKWKFLN